MIAQVFKADPAELSSRYPRRVVVEEREVENVIDAIEEIAPLPGGWMVITATDRHFHFAGDQQGRWDLQSMVVFNPEEEK